MYKNNYDIDNKSPQSSATTLYGSKFFIVNSEFKVYECLNNGEEVVVMDKRLKVTYKIIQELFVEVANMCTKNEICEQGLFSTLHIIKGFMTNDKAYSNVNSHKR